MKKLYYLASIFLFLIMHISGVVAQEPVLSNYDFNPLPVISFFGDYDSGVDIDPNGTTVNSVTVRTTMINGEDANPLNPGLGTEFYPDGEKYGDGQVSNVMTNIAGNTWSYPSIRPDDIYAEIFYVPTDIAFNNAPGDIVVDKSTYHIFKLNNPFTMVDASNFFIEVNAIPLSSRAAIDLQVYVVGNNNDISFFQGTDWRQNADVEMVGSISKDDDFHHIHTEHSKHHLVRLATNPDRTVGNKHIDISGDFWVVLMASTPSRKRSWNLRCHDKSKNGGRDNDGQVGQPLSSLLAT
jgi:hypothetical protein